MYGISLMFTFKASYANSEHEAASTSYLSLLQYIKFGLESHLKRQIVLC